MRFHLSQLALAALLTGASTLAFAADDWQARVGEALGKPGSAAPGGIYRVGLPRTDLKRSEEHTSELQSHLISYAVFCLKKKKKLKIYKSTVPDVSVTLS